MHCIGILCDLLRSDLLLGSLWHKDTIEATLRVVRREGAPVYIVEEGMILDLLRAIVAEALGWYSTEQSLEKVLELW